MVEFSDFIEDMELMDPQLEGGKYTWFKGDGNNAASRIDRFLFSKEWDDSFTKINQTLLHRLVSDHNPVALQCGEWEQNKSYFKFDNWWLNTDGFVDRIKGWWESFEFTGNPDHILACKLKALKGKLKEWSRTNMGNLGTQKTQILSELVRLEAIQENRVLTEEETTLKASLLMEYEEHLKNEEIAWRQRSRALWLKEGDRNTSYFHKLANAHRRSSHIDQLVVQGTTIMDPERIKGEIIGFYEKLYT